MGDTVVVVVSPGLIGVLNSSGFTVVDVVGVETSGLSVKCVVVGGSGVVFVVCP